MLDHNDEIPRPVRRSDFLVIFTNLIHNFAQVVATFTEEIKEISIYHANRNTRLNNAWEVMATDLESLEGDQ